MSESKDLKLSVARATRTTWTVTASCGDKPPVIDTVRMLNAVARAAFAATAAQALAIKNEDLLPALNQVAADLAAEQERQQTENNERAQKRKERAQTPTEPGNLDASVECLVEFLRTFKPQYRTKSSAIQFAGLPMPVKSSDCYLLDGARAIIRTLPEHSLEQNREGIVTPTKEIQLAKEMFRLAFARLARQLPEETPDDRAEEITEQIRAELVAFLNEPRLLQPGMGGTACYRLWARRLVPDGVWRQCFAHPVFGLQGEDGTLRLGVLSDCLMARLGSLRNNFKSAAQAGRFLHQHQLIQAHGDGSARIRVAGQQIRIWEFSTSLVESVCGHGPGMQTGLPTDEVEAYTDWTGEEAGTEVQING